MKPSCRRKALSSVACKPVMPHQCLQHYVPDWRVDLVRHDAFCVRRYLQISLRFLFQTAVWVGHRTHSNSVSRQSRKRGTATLRTPARPPRAIRASRILSPRRSRRILVRLQYTCCQTSCANCTTALACQKSNTIYCDSASSTHCKQNLPAEVLFTRS